MKLLKTFLAVVMLTATLAACKKDKQEPAFVPEGLWTGKIGSGSEIPNGQYALKLKSGGVIERINSNGSATAVGTWTLKGTSFSAVYTFLSGSTVVDVTGTLNIGQKRLHGTWTNDGGESGSWHATKQ